MIVDENKGFTLAENGRDDQIVLHIFNCKTSAN